jgi:hypothetical protein
MENFMHTWSDVLALFQINAATLWRWCKRASIQPHQYPSDMRRRFLDNDQLLILARLHNRVLRVDFDAVLLNEIERLERRIAELERRV